MTEEIEAVEAVEDDVLSAEQVDGEQPQTEAVEDDESGEEQPAPKPKKTAQERINELTRKAREAEREREYWRNEAINRQQAPQPHAAPAQPRDEAPHPDDFHHGDADPLYLVALAKYETKAEIRQEYEARDQQTRLTGQLSTFEQKVAEQFPDGEPEGIASLKALPRLRSEITDVILTSDKGPLLADHLGDNPSVLNRLSGLPPHMIGFELARIEAALSAPAPPPINRVTKAPDPAPKPRGAGGQFAVSPETSDFAAFEKLADKVRSS